MKDILPKLITESVKELENDRFTYSMGEPNILDMLEKDGLISRTKDLQLTEKGKYEARKIRVLLSLLEHKYMESEYPKIT